MTREWRKGMIVRFGRKSGEKTEGKIIKVNPKSLKIEQIGGRGVRKAHREGTIWTVHPNLVELVNDSEGGSNFGEGWETIEVPADSVVELLIGVLYRHNRQWGKSDCEDILKDNKIPTQYHSFLTAQMLHVKNATRS